MGAGGIVLVALTIAVGLAGVIVPLLPGTLLVYAAIAVWAVVEHRLVSWVVLAIVTVVLGVGLLVKYLWPVRRLRAADIGRWTLVTGVALGIVGFFVIPVVGLVVGFVLGVYLAEVIARRDHLRAWASTVHAAKGVALSVGVELLAGLFAAVVWLTGVVLS